MAIHLKTKSHGFTSGAKCWPNNHKRTHFLFSSPNGRSTFNTVFQLATLIQQKCTRNNRMVNRKLSQVPLPTNGRIDTRSQRLQTQSYEAVQRARLSPISQTFTQKVPPLVVGSSDPFTLPPPIIPPATYSPLPPRLVLPPRPVHEPNTQLSPSTTTRRFSRGLTPINPSTGSQGSSSMLSMNSHINPFFLNTSHSSSLQHTPSPGYSSSNNNYSSPLKRPAPDNAPSEIAIDTDNELPQGIFDNPRVAKAPAHPVASMQTAATPDLESEEDEVPDEERTFQVYFNLYQPECADEPEPKKRQRTPGGPRNLSAHTKTTKPKYKNFNPKLPNQLTLQPKEISFTFFRKQLFNTCNEDLPGVSEVLERTWVAKDLAIQGFVNCSKGYKGKDKQAIKTPESFRTFINASLMAPASTTMGFRIIHENPSKTENARRSLANVLKASASAEPGDSDESEGEASVASAGSAILSEGERKFRTLMERFEKDFKAGENVTCVKNPLDSNQVLLLNTSRIRTWADDWADGVAGVDEVNPPMKRRGVFSWIQACDYEEEKAKLLGLPPPRGVVASVDGGTATGTIIHHNYYGPPGGAAAVAPMFGDGTHQNRSAVTPSRLSPPPLNPEGIDFERFLTFAKFGPENTRIRDILNKEGIDDFLRLLDRSTYSIEAFHKMGIPFAQAEDLWKAVPKFNYFLKSL